MSDDFFDAFGDEIQVDWSKISESELDAMVDKLEKQDVDRIFNEMNQAIKTNNRNKAIVKTTLTVLQTAVKLGMKVV